MAKKKAADPKPAPDKLTRVRLDVDAAEHRHLRIAAAKANVAMSQYVRQLVREDMERKGER